MNLSTQRFTLIDALRGIAAMSVVLFHAVEGHHVDSTPAWLRSIIGHGHLGVAIFFVLSGFVIAYSLRDKEMTYAGVGRFMLRRSIRLDPPYWLAIGFAIAFSALAGTYVRDRAPETFTAAQVIAHVFYVQEILGYKNIVWAFWTLAYEVQFYLVFALILAARLRGLLVAAFIVSLLWPLSLAPEIRGLFVNLWYGFLLGVGCYYTIQTPRLLLPFSAYILILLAGGIIAQDAHAIACVLTAILILSFGLADRLNVLNFWPLQKLGLISYSLYLFHDKITGATFRVGYMLTGRTPATEWLWWAVSIAASIAAATIVYILVERPSIKLSKTLFGRTKMVTAQSSSG